MSALDFGSPRDDERMFWLAVCGELPSTYLLQEEHSYFFGGPRGALWLRMPPGCGADVATEGGLTVVLDGRLDDPAALELNSAPPGAHSTIRDAMLVLRGYRSLGDRIFDLLRGEFVVLVWDEQAGSVSVARDRLGRRPLHFAVRGGVTIVSPSPNVVVSAGAPAEPSGAAIAEWVLSASLPTTETFHAHIERLAPGTARSWVGGTSRTRTLTWPAAPTVPSDPREASAEIDRLLTLSVSRYVGEDRLGVFLSGGVDSAAVAAIAASLRRKAGQPPPEALSLRFDTPADETVAQRAITEALALPWTSSRLGEATRGEDVLAAALRLAGRMWLPPVNPWAVGYEGLSQDATRRGVTMILTGEGGNEVLEPSWDEITALMMRLRLRAAREVAGAWSSHGGPSASAAMRSAVVRVARARARGVGLRVARKPIGHPLSGLLLRRFDQSLPRWFLPDRTLRRAAFERRADRVLAREATYPLVFNARDIAIYFEHSHLTVRRLGTELASPFYDEQLLALRAAIPVEALVLETQYKAPGVAIVERHAGGTSGLRRHFSAPSMGRTFETMLARGVAEAIRNAGSLSLLADLGVVEPKGASAAFAGLSKASIDPSAERGYYQVWQVLAGESWLNAHFGEARRDER